MPTSSPFSSARTARGRKGTSEGRVRQILQFVDEGWSLENIKTGLVSGEGLIWHVRDPIYKTENVKDKGRIVGTEQVLADPGDRGQAAPRHRDRSLQHRSRVCRRETNTLSPTLRSAWDSGILRTLAKNSPATATNAHISVIGHITQEELRRALAEVDGFNGFANRFLWVAVRRSRLLPDGGQDLDLSPFAERLALTIDKARSVDRMHRDQGAAALWRKAYAELADDTSTGLLAAVTSRAEAQVLRLSMIYALLDGSGTIRRGAPPGGSGALAVLPAVGTADLRRRQRRPAPRPVARPDPGDAGDQPDGIAAEDQQQHQAVAEFVCHPGQTQGLRGASGSRRSRQAPSRRRSGFPLCGGEFIEFIEISPKDTPQSNPNNSINSINTQAQQKRGMEEVRI